MQKLSGDLCQEALTQSFAKSVGNNNYKKRSWQGRDLYNMVAQIITKHNVEKSSFPENFLTFFIL